jgi:hypothetical protein
LQPSIPTRSDNDFTATTGFLPAASVLSKSKDFKFTNFNLHALTNVHT